MLVSSVNVNTHNNISACTGTVLLARDFILIVMHVSYVLVLVSGKTVLLTSPTNTGLCA